MKSKPTPIPATPATKQRARAEAELREFGAQPEHHPMMAELHRRAEAQVRKLRRKRGAAAPVPPATADPQRLLHELQVHQVELEMQNEELRKTRDEMEAERDKYTDLYDFAPIGYFTLDREGTIADANLAGASLLGVARAALGQRRWGAFVSPADRAAFAAFLQQVFKSKAREECDVRLLLHGTDAVDVRIRAIVSSSGQACQLAVSDITERKQAEDNVRVSEIRYRRLFETAHDGVLLLDPGTRKITDANPYMTKLLGYPHAQLVGKELFEIGLLKDEGASQEMFRKLKLKHEVRYEDLPLESQGGRHQEVEVVANLYEENGHPVIQCNIRDITGRKKAEIAQRRLDVMTASNLKLKQEIVRRQTVEEALHKTEQEQSRLLKQSHLQQEQLRDLSRQILHAQEEERKRISRELHDVITQTLVGINVHLAALSQGAAGNPASLQQKIARTQRLVEKSVGIVHQFARELRPTVLDDLGLIPALQAYLKGFMEDTGVRTSLKAFAGIEKSPGTLLTLLYRVAQEALTNVARHAKASQVEVSILNLEGVVCMEIKDNGQGFELDATSGAKKNKRLGLLGMKERVEMAGGTFRVESAPGKSTTVRVEIPAANGEAAETPLEKSPATSPERP